MQQQQRHRWPCRRYGSYRQSKPAEKSTLLSDSRNALMNILPLQNSSFVNVEVEKKEKKELISKNSVAKLKKHKDLAGF